ncbi:flagellar hook-length control protein FliK [uncultured Gammaproteobacteria bacterium]
MDALRLFVTSAKGADSAQSQPALPPFRSDEAHGLFNRTLEEHLRRTEPAEVRDRDRTLASPRSRDGARDRDDDRGAVRRGSARAVDRHQSSTAKPAATRTSQAASQAASQAERGRTSATVSTQAMRDAHDDDVAVFLPPASEPASEPDDLEGLQDVRVNDGRDEPSSSLAPQDTQIFGSLPPDSEAVEASETELTVAAPLSPDDAAQQAVSETDNGEADPTVAPLNPGGGAGSVALASRAGGGVGGEAIKGGRKTGRGHPEHERSEIEAKLAKTEADGKTAALGTKATVDQGQDSLTGAEAVDEGTELPPDAAEASVLAQTVDLTAPLPPPVAVVVPLVAALPVTGPVTGPISGSASAEGRGSGQGAAALSATAAPGQGAVVPSPAGRPGATAPNQNSASGATATDPGTGSDLSDAAVPVALGADQSVAVPRAAKPDTDGIQTKIQSEAPSHAAAAAAQGRGAGQGGDVSPVRRAGDGGARPAATAVAPTKPRSAQTAEAEAVAAAQVAQGEVTAVKSAQTSVSKVATPVSGAVPSPELLAGDQSSGGERDGQGEGEGERPHDGARTETGSASRGDGGAKANQAAATGQTAQQRFLDQLSGSSQRPGSAPSIAANATTTAAGVRDGAAGTQSAIGSETLATAATPAATGGEGPTATAMIAEPQRAVSETQEAGAPTPVFRSMRGQPSASVPEQVAVQIRRGYQNGNNRITMQLRPEELGRIDIRLEIARDGRVSAMIAVERPQTLEMLQKDSKSLERALQGAGLQADSGSLSFSLQGDGSTWQQADQGRFGSGRGKSPRRIGARAGTDIDDDQLEAVTSLWLAPGRLDVRV